MSLLLDTHVLLWCLGNPDRLRRETRKKIEAPAQMVFVSAVSAWEIELKRALGKLKAPSDLGEQLEKKRFTELPVHLRHARALGSLPDHHRDPFDRMLIAQAMTDGLVIVTADDRIRSYPVRTLAA
ncbi:MAG TPA: type II toxin-antitoxin system VapC family toxin [Polyangiaceae bacterium]|nr:type II toxin-antitoxin system VapC family toxin [Polyangiaceae bacterium]